MEALFEGVVGTEHVYRLGSIPGVIGVIVGIVGIEGEGQRIHLLVSVAIPSGEEELWVAVGIGGIEVHRHVGRRGSGEGHRHGVDEASCV